MLCPFPSLPPLLPPVRWYYNIILEQKGYLFVTHREKGGGVDIVCILCVGSYSSALLTLSP